MSLLTNSLNNIFVWLENNNPAVAASLQSGLTYAEIEDKVASLPFRLPKELYELYQWRNGSREENEKVEFFECYRFLPLEEALNIRSDIKEQDYWIIDELYPYGWFPIFTFEGEYYSVIGSEKQRDFSPIIYIYHDENISYISLTKMMQTIAECYQTGIYYLNEDSYWETKQEEENIIRLKHNPGIITTSHYGKYNPKIIKKFARLKVTNVYSQNHSCLISTKKDYKNNLIKEIKYLGGKVITIQTSKIKSNSNYDSYNKLARFYCDYDIYEDRVIAKRKNWFLWEKINIKRRYINNNLNQETIYTNINTDFLLLVYIAFCGLLIILTSFFK